MIFIEFRIYKAIRDYGKLKRIFLFEEDDESRLYRKFQDTWKDYYAKKKEAALTKSRRRLKEELETPIINKVFMHKAQTYFEVGEDFSMEKQMEKIIDRKKFQRKLKNSKHDGKKM